ncbi:hypothetical protein AVEN_166691-1 [Araneus ventricosus]|uniref:Uncharacterized protein n=1 Tax=Araneus ventricosus TaxID=182803 RepID=A0A4Y2KHU1_ARAVE|nr:hypothetical protein AVEN_166691-1 [Araneus ventricosus]
MREKANASDSDFTKIIYILFENIRGRFYFQPPKDHYKKEKSREQNEFITKSYVQTWLLFDIITEKIQAFIISVDQVSNLLFEERCRQRCEVCLNVALNNLISLEALAFQTVLQFREEIKITRR